MKVMLDTFIDAIDYAGNFSGKEEFRLYVLKALSKLLNQVGKEPKELIDNIKLDLECLSMEVES